MTSHDNNQLVAHTGHSLGGAISMLMAIGGNSKAVVFDSPGVLDLVFHHRDKFDANLRLDQVNIEIYNTAPHYINAYNTHHTEKIFRLYIGHDTTAWFMTTQQHLMASIVEQFDPISGKAHVAGQNHIYHHEAVDIHYAYLKCNGNGYIETVECLSKYNYKCETGVEITVNTNDNHEIWGSTSCNDTIISGGGNNTIWLYGGNDNIEDISGNDNYVLVPHFFSGKTVISDHDKEGTIFIGNLNCPLKNAFYSKQDQHYVFDLSQNNCKISYMGNDLLNFTVFLITYDCFFGFNCDLNIRFSSEQTNSSGELIIKSFKNGDLGINLHKENELYDDLNLVSLTTGVASFLHIFAYSFLNDYFMPLLGMNQANMEEYDSFV